MPKASHFANERRVRSDIQPASDLIRPDVSDGSNSDLDARNRDARFAPVNGRRQYTGGRPKSAMIGLTRGSKQSRYSDSYWRPVLRL